MLLTEVVPMPDHDQRFKTLIKELFPSLAAKEYTVG